MFVLEAPRLARIASQHRVWREPLRRMRSVPRVAWLVGAATTLLWSVLAIVRQHKLQTGVDLGLYTQAVQRYAHGQMPWSYLKSAGGFNVLGDHFTPIVAALAPFYRLWPHVETLLIGQAALVGITAVVLTRTAQQLLGSTQAAAMIGAAFALSWGISGMALFDFHEVAFALPLLAFSLDRALRGDWTVAVPWSLPLMLVKEDSAFLIAGIALACWRVHHRRLAIATMTYAVASFALVVMVVIPALSYSGRYTYWSVATGHGHHGGAFAVLGNFATALLSGAPLMTVAMIMAATLLLPVRSPLCWTMVPSLLVRFSSAQPGYWGPTAHYNATLMVIGFYAAFDALARIWTGQRRQLVPPRMLGAGFLVAALGLTALTPLKAYIHPDQWTCNTKCHDAVRIAAEIPDGASVAATTYLVDQLVDRTNVHLLTNGMKDSNGHLYYADFVIVDNLDPMISPSGTLMSFLNQHNYVPVDASTSGISLLMFDPSAAAAYNDATGSPVQYCKPVTGGDFCTTIDWRPHQRPTSPPPSA